MTKWNEMMSMPRRLGTLRLRRSPLPLLATTLTAVVGCSELTSVDTLDVVTLSDLENRSGARTLRAGAITGFANALTGDNLNSQIGLTARVSDELVATHPNDTYDRRQILDLTAGTSGFRTLSNARVRLLQAIVAMKRFDSESRDDIAELFSLLAYTELFLAENFCSGVPLSSIVDGQPVYGAQLTTEQTFDRAVADFDSAIAYAEAGTDASQLAQVGRARALLGLGRSADAAAAAANVPIDFAYRTSHSSSAQRNALSQLAPGWTVADREGGNGVDFVTAADPRVLTQLLPEPGADGQTPVYAPGIYGSTSAPVTLASGIEARLIEAEALLQGGNATDALTVLNELRAAVEGLESLPPEPTETARIDQLFRERAFWLFMTGHRHGDLRRLARQYGRDVESVFPSGDYRDGLIYGSDVTLDLHVLEQNNPNFAGCFDRNP